MSARTVALEYLKLSKLYGPPMAYGNTTIDEAIAALETEIAQEVEPVAIAECKVVHGHPCQFLNRTTYGMQILKDGDKLYTAPQAVNAWQPIETAPKDGTLILVREPRCSGLAVMYLHGWKYESGGICYLEPTHWMPLPGSPA